MAFDLAVARQKITDMLDQHPDVVKDCGMACILNYLVKSPWLAGLIAYHNLDIEPAVRACISFDFEWGEQFRLMNQRAPTLADWNVSYYDRANAFAERLGALTPYRTDERQPRLRWEFGGPF